MKKRREKLFSLTEKDFEFKATKSTGTGGQKKNKTSNAIQAFHRPSEAMAFCDEFREQAKNKKRAFKKLTETLEFKTWLKMKIDAYMGKIVIEEQDDFGKVQKRALRGEEV